MRSLHLAARTKAVIYSFSPEDVDWNGKAVHALTLNSQRLWVRRRMPLPHVVYNRLLVGRKREMNAAHTLFRKRLDEHRIPMFNRTYFNKQHIFQLLHRGKENESIRHLPETLDNPSADNLQHFFNRHPTVFLKPTGGFAGIGIYRMMSTSEKDATLHFHSGRHARFLRFPSRRAMIQFVRHKTNGFRRHVAQQGIALLRHRDCPLDFRVHANRGRDNRWHISGIGAKKAGKGSVTTHLRTGGSVYPPLTLLKHFFKQQAPSVLKRLHATCLSLADAIGRRSAHPVGELGFDIGIDERGHIWMFEANSKPGRSIFKHHALRTALYRCDQHIIEYCLYLAKQGRGG